MTIFFLPNSTNFLQFFWIFFPICSWSLSRFLSYISIFSTRLSPMPRIIFSKFYQLFAIFLQFFLNLLVIIRFLNSISIFSTRLSPMPQILSLFLIFIELNDFFFQMRPSVLKFEWNWLESIMNLVKVWPYFSSIFAIYLNFFSICSRSLDFWVLFLFLAPVYRQCHRS